MPTTIYSDSFNSKYREERKELSEYKRKIIAYKIRHPDARNDEIALQCNTTPSEVQKILEECADYYNIII